MSDPEMNTESVRFYSEGTHLAGLLKLPPGEGPWPAVVQGPGWLGLKDAKVYDRYHRALTAAGFALLIFDYRGFGDSEGDQTQLIPSDQLEDLVNAVTYLCTRPEVDATSIGVFGSGGTGGGNAVLLAATDTRVRCAVSQVPVADGEDWLRRMRREHEWYEFLQRLDEDRRQRVLKGSGELVHPREDIMIATPERRATSIKKDVDARIPAAISLRSAEAILAYRPIDVVDRVTNLLVIAVENDAVTPTDHALTLYERARSPKKLILQRQTTHYAAYEQYGDFVTPMIVDWYRAHLRPGPVEVRSANSDEPIVYLGAPQEAS